MLTNVHPSNFIPNHRCSNNGADMFVCFFVKPLWTFKNKSVKIEVIFLNEIWCLWFFLPKSKWKLGSAPAPPGLVGCRRDPPAPATCQSWSGATPCFLNGKKWFIDNITNPLLPRPKLNVVVQVKPWLYLKTLIDCWYIGHTKGQKRVTFPLSLIESVNQSSKFWIKICGFHAQVFDWFSRVFHCLFTGFSRSFHALLRFGVGFVWNSGVRYIFILFYTSTHWVW